MKEFLGKGVIISAINSLKKGDASIYGSSPLGQGRKIEASPFKSPFINKILKNKAGSSPLAAASSSPAVTETALWNRILLRAGSSFSDEFFPGQLNIVEDRLNQSLAQLFSFMKGNNSATAVGMAEEYMAAFLADCFKAVFLRIWITTVGLRLVRRIIQILPAVRQIQACWGFLPPGIKLLLL